MLLKITPFLQWLASFPGMYDAIQIAAGAPFSAPVMRRWLEDVHGVVVDIGGGTGRIKPLLPGTARHVCLDADPRKLSRYTRKFQHTLAIHADALKLPLRPAAAHTIVFIAVSHHLDDRELELAFDEIARVLAPAGTFYFLDAVLSPSRTMSRLMWRHDRGANPRTAERLVSGLEKHFRVVDSFEYTQLHRYFACRCQHATVAAHV